MRLRQSPSAGSEWSRQDDRAANAYADLTCDQVQAMLGHSTIVTTADIYTSVLPELQREAAATIAALVLAAVRTGGPLPQI